MTSKISTVIARRKLRDVQKKDNPIDVTLGKPKKLNESEWECKYHISGIGNGKMHCAYGLDAFQALLMAIEGIRTKLEVNRKSLSWSGGDPGDIGFPRFVPQYFGLDFSDKLENLIDQELTQFAKRAEKNT